MNARFEKTVWQKILILVKATATDGHDAAASLDWNGLLL